ncbi:hypothetical protein AKJ63_00300 [candidate division MSBL1 archaeon SCGC-AAA259D18]|uniref:CobQ/CobB/MinD/ParA nucleotide binding domain-containing protein n=1 Tax=candidate division MSBL1 archaeon SCGC-AAA259D18 TaxID=1698262 RepID=A0A133UCN2_9EURY|nr:hypothetical protein AKJ63_00300 [candidate division MSBL1 archaeon SCGC-AAA259D18]
MVVNRVGRSSDLSRREIEHFMGETLGSLSVLSEIPEDETVQEAEREEIPVTVYEPEALASQAIYELAGLVAGGSELPYEPYEEEEVDRTVEKLTRALTGPQS